jgi:hypothetical protein
MKVGVKIFGASTQKVWKETLDALDFACVRAIVESMKSQTGGLEHL